MYIQSLKLHNIKAFETLDLDFTRPNSQDYAGINLFVGGNASGKSTLLKCIAMTLSGPTIANNQITSPAGWVRHGSTKGCIELKVQREGQDQLRGKEAFPSGEGFNIGLQLDYEDTIQITTLRAKEYRTPTGGTRILTPERGPWHPETTGWFLSAYGPLRRLTGSSTEALYKVLGGGKLASCVTLFREDAALSESETWLKQEYARTLEQTSLGQPVSPLVKEVQNFLNDGLLPDGFRIDSISVDHVYITTPTGGKLPMRDLSDGCRSTFALILDIIHSMALTFRETNLFEQDATGRQVINKSGVILIDELEAHLHPSWQRLICEWLRTRFPHIQFFITTHSPLIAQVADMGGLYVLPMPHEMIQGQGVRRLLPHEQERVTLGRAEKVLLGEAFGLKQTWSRQADKLVRRWEEMAAKRNANGSLSPSEQKEYQDLTRQMEIIFDDEV